MRCFQIGCGNGANFLYVSHFRRNLLFHSSPFDLLRRRPHRIEEGRRQGHNAPDADDEEEAEVAVALFDLLAHRCNLCYVIDIFNICYSMTSLVCLGTFK